uniref:Uncharacterized protein n=1 Tax=Arundo donax TaxID=35708 RepID=A0A0A8YAH0_ARUDO
MDAFPDEWTSAPLSPAFPSPQDLSLEMLLGGGQAWVGIDVAQRRCLKQRVGVRHGAFPWVLVGKAPHDRSQEASASPWSPLPRPPVLRAVGLLLVAHAGRRRRQQIPGVLIALNRTKSTKKNNGSITNSMV